jgi:hypothetical protein
MRQSISGEARIREHRNPPTGGLYCCGEGITPDAAATSQGIPWAETETKTETRNIGAKEALCDYLFQYAIRPHALVSARGQREVHLTERS